MISQTQLKELLHYDPLSGAFTWKERSSLYFSNSKSCKSWNSRFSGKEAGVLFKSSDSRFYIRICIFGRRYYAHRLAWMYMNGTSPCYEIDHIDGNGENNSFDNLRDVPTSENQKNSKRHKHNTSGLMGVRWNRERRKWHSMIKIKKELVTLGWFDSKLEAACARKSAEQKYKFHENHGRIVS